jgi:hypothetical protein
MTAIVAVLLLCIGCQTPAGPSGDQSPGTDGGSSRAFAAQGAQTVGRDQGQAETPQTNTSGTATNNMKFASEGVDTGIAETLVRLAEAKDWTAEQLAAIFKSMNGAPENVTIEIGGNIQAQSGSNENVGSTGGTGGGGGAGAGGTGGTVTND